MTLNYLPHVNESNKYIYFNVLIIYKTNYFEYIYKRTKITVIQGSAKWRFFYFLI